MFNQFNENIRQIYLATSLYDCIEDNNINAIEILLRDNGANPNIVLPDKGITPFHLVIGSPVEKIAEEITRLFLQHGGDPNIRSDDKMTPVHVAAAWGRINVLDLLLKCGGDPNLKDEEEKTPLDYAHMEGHLKVIDLLEEHSSNLLYETCQNNYNLTLEKVIINNGNIVAEYDALKSENCFDSNTNCLKQLPEDEVNSYVKNWCLEHANITKENIELQNNETKNKISETFVIDKNEDDVEEVEQVKNKYSYFSDEFVTRRPRKKYFNIEDINEENYVSNFNTKSLKKTLNLSHESDVIGHFTESFYELLDNLQIDDNMDENWEKSISNKKCDNDVLNKSIGDLINCSSNNSKSEIIYNEPDDNILEKSFIFLSDDSVIYKKDVSEESGLQPIPSDSSVFENSLEPLNDCRFIGSIDSHTSKDSESSKYTTCEETANVKTHELNIIDSSLMTSDVSDIKIAETNLKILNETRIIESTNEQNRNILNETRIVENTNKQGEKISQNCDILNVTHIVSKTNNVLDNIAHNETNFNENTNLNHATGISCQISAYNDTANDSFFSVAEEYKYTDEKEGIILIERRYLVTPQICIDDSKSTSSVANTVASSLPTTIDYDTETLRKELTYRGEEPGPITSTTKRVYLRKLMRLQKTPNEELPKIKNCSKAYSVELEKTLRNPMWKDDLKIYKELESAMVRQFTHPDPSKRWREGVSKASFTYLLMDPRITQNLPSRSEKLEIEETWKTFLSSVFYVGKGKRSRPYSHLYEAILHWDKGETDVESKKIQNILDIWNDGKGVVCLHIFQNVIPVEAYTREAAIISAIKLQNLKNAKAGDFYGVTATWSQRQKRLLGVYLLYRAMFIFLNEGERQLRPDDI